MPGGRPRIRDAAYRKQYQRDFYERTRLERIADAVKWSRENPDRRSEICKKYRQSEKGKISQLRYKRARRAAHRLARPAWRNQDAIDAIYLSAARLGMHVDHIVPLRHELVCGLHVENNLRLITPVENQRKGNRWWPDMPHVELML